MAAPDADTFNQHAQSYRQQTQTACQDAAGRTQSFTDSPTTRFCTAAVENRITGEDCITLIFFSCLKKQEHEGNSDQKQQSVSR